METEQNLALNQDYLETVDLFMKLPFNTALTGYKMLVTATVLALNNTKPVLNLYKDIYEVVAEKYSINAKCVEKSIRGVITSISNYCAVYNDLEFPNTLIKNAVKEARPKAFICSICNYIKFKRYQENYLKKNNSKD
ncbi:MAG: sporulation initiation factor Spo0A C-terminal domain-containing protein [Christensenellales bacterium]